MEIEYFPIILLVLVVSVVCRRQTEEESKLYELTGQDLETKEDIPMSRFRGKV